MNVRLNYIKNMQFTASARNFNDISIDMPESFHGEDTGPSPIEYLLIGIGGCLSSSYVYCLKKKGIKVKELDVFVDGKLKRNGPDLNLKLGEIELVFEISFNEGTSDEEIDSCFELFKKKCPISDLIIKGVPLKVKITKKKEKN